MESTPSSSSHFLKCLPALKKKNSEYPISGGINAVAIAAMRTSVMNMNTSDSTSSSIMRNSDMSWSDINREMVSASEVQRCIMSPVLCALRKDSGSRCMCENSVLRMRRISTWLARVLKYMRE